MKFVLLAGLFAGFYLASKYFGLIFVLASLPIILMGKDTTKNLAIYLAMVIAMGFQLYLWNYLHTSDPLFPSLTNFFSYPDTIYCFFDHFRAYASITWRCGTVNSDGP